MIKRTTTIQVGSIKSPGGVLSISYTPEDGVVQLYAFDPDDRRKAGIFFGLSSSGYQSLKRLLSELEDVIDNESNTVNEVAVCVKAVPFDVGPVEFKTSKGRVYVSQYIYREAVNVAVTGSVASVATLLMEKMPALDPVLADEIAIFLLKRCRQSP